VAGRLRTKRTVLGSLINGFFACQKAQHRLESKVRVWTSVLFGVLLFPFGVKTPPGKNRTSRPGSQSGSFCLLKTSLSDKKIKPFGVKVVYLFYY
ncbi:MAG: hypothetical protein ACPGWR_17325, partial [Ardenticatenaceae bacterium]